MSDWLLNEPAIAAVHELLRDGLPGELAALAAELPADEASALEPPADVLDYPASIGELAVFPTVTIIDRPASITDDTGFSATGQHQLLVVAHLLNADQRILAWALRRYAQAIVRVLSAGRQLSQTVEGAGYLHIVGTAPGDALETADPGGVQTWQSWTGVLVRVERDEL